MVFTFNELPGQRSTTVADRSPHRLAHGTTLPASCLKTFTWLLAETLTLGYPRGWLQPSLSFCQAMMRFTSANRVNNDLNPSKSIRIINEL